MEQSNTVSTAIYHRIAYAGTGLDAETLARLEDMIAFAEPQYSKVFIDIGYSGLTFDRPACHQLEKELEDSYIQTLIIWDYSRLSRNRFECESWMRDLYCSGVELLIASHDYERYAPLHLSILDEIKYRMETYYEV